MFYFLWLLFILIFAFCEMISILQYILYFFSFIYQYVSANLDLDWRKIDWMGGWSAIRKPKSQRHFYNVNFSHLLPHKDIQVPGRTET